MVQLSIVLVVGAVKGVAAVIVADWHIAASATVAILFDPAVHVVVG